MKKLLLILTALSVMTLGLAAQDTTWTNPLSEKTDTVPHSMLNAVTNGTMYDGIDVIITSPAELSEFPGISIYTAYGNFESWANLPKDGTINPVTNINPFTTTAFNPTNSDGNVAFQLGYMMPIAGRQSGIVAGFEFGHTNNLTGYNGYDAAIPGSVDNATGTETNVVDAGGTLDSIAYTNSESFDITSRTLDHHVRVGTGIDLGFMGVSLLFNLNSTSQILGGTYDYTWTAGADDVEYPTANTATTTSKSIKYGYADGDAKLHGVKNSDWDIEATGQIPLDVAGISMPLTASIRVGGNGDGTSAYGIPQTVTVTDAYVATDNAAGTASDTSTLTYTTGVANLNYGTINGEFLSTVGPTTGQAATFPAIPALPGNYADNTDTLKDGDFNFGISARIDPKFTLSEILTARTRAAIDFDLNLDRNNSSGFIEMNFSRADDGTTNSEVYYKDTLETSNETTEIDLSFEIGGILEATTPSGRLTVSSGLFYNPVFDINTTANNSTVNTQTHTVTDNSVIGTAAEISAANAWGDLVLGTWEGSMTRTTTTEYSGPTKNTTVNHQFIIPVTAKIDIVKDKFSLIGGYVLSSTVTSETTETGVALTPEIVDVFTTTAGANVSPTVVSTGAGDNLVSTTSREVSSAAWAGQMNFMIRWIPIESMTVDFYGNSVMNALNFNVFGGGAGFNPGTFIGTLGLSVSFHF